MPLFYFWDLGHLYYYYFELSFRSIAYFLFVYLVCELLPCSFICAVFLSFHFFQGVHWSIQVLEFEKVQFIYLFFYHAFFLFLVSYMRRLYLKATMLPNILTLIYLMLWNLLYGVLYLPTCLPLLVFSMHSYLSISSHPEGLFKNIL